MVTHEFRIYHAITGKYVRRIKLDDVSYSDPVYGTGGSLSASAPIAPGQRAVDLKSSIVLDSHALYVFRDGDLVWGGPLSSYGWRWKERRLSIGAIQWKQWFYDKFLTPDMTANPVEEKKYFWTATDQFQIARNLIAAAMADSGCPTIIVGSETSGIVREHTTYGMNFQYLGDRIDSMATRDAGFEWNVEPRIGATGDVELVFTPYYPERGSYQQGMSLRFKSTQRGGNIVLPDEFEVTSESRRNRVWASGSGTPPDQVIAYDEDPDLTADLILNRESVTNYQDVSDVDLLAEHARAERFYNGVPLNAFTVRTSLDNPPIGNYGSGDRARLIIKDEWMDVDLPAVRIVDRTINVNRSDKPDEAELLLNLNDFELPENTSEVEG